uniref:Acyl-CoA binding domain containing 4 n=1 Tax=Astatotilapia calliptera TaxID=8154 RepID=A0AAX7VTA3_ASTCA
MELKKSPEEIFDYTQEKDLCCFVGSYRPSYKVMLRFYSLYKQAVCGPCTVPRPGFWDPVGRYKWDAWNQLGKMSSESAMAAYVDEMKKVAQEVIDTMPIDENTASLFKYFEPLYLFIDDMPRPPESLLKLREGQIPAWPEPVSSKQKDQSKQIEHLISKRVATSVAWTWFGYEKSDTDQKTVICKLWRKPVPTTDSNTTNLFNHRRKNHVKECGESLWMRSKKEPTGAQIKP